jgi:hypothetical protein
MATAGKAPAARDSSGAKAMNRNRTMSGGEANAGMVGLPDHMLNYDSKPGPRLEGRYPDGGWMSMGPWEFRVTGADMNYPMPTPRPYTGMGGPEGPRVRGISGAGRRNNLAGGRALSPAVAHAIASPTPGVGAGFQGYGYDPENYGGFANTGYGTTNYGVNPNMAGNFGAGFGQAGDSGWGGGGFSDGGYGDYGYGGEGPGGQGQQHG